MKKIKNVLLVICAAYIMLTIIFSTYYTVNVRNIVKSSSYTQGTEYQKYSNHISEADYKEFCMLSQNNESEYECNGIIVVFPHNLLSGKKVEWFMTENFSNGDWMSYYYNFDIEFNGFNYYISNLKVDGAGMDV